MSDAFDLYLASASPRRAELLRQIGITFRVISGSVDETVLAGETAEQYVLRLAREKALAGWQNAACDHQHPVLAADTSVVLDAEVLGKPANVAEARAMLARLSGRSHQVMTAVGLHADGFSAQRLNVSQVQFRCLRDSELDAYAASGEGLDKAGAYAVQGRAARFITRLDGSYSGVMGLPLHDVDSLLNEWAAANSTAQQPVSPASSSPSRVAR